MYSLIQICVNRKRMWILMDGITYLPLLYPLRYHIDNLSFRSLSTQFSSLQALKFFYDFWEKKHGVTFCYSFHQSGHDPSIAVNELTAFFQYLENGRSCQYGLLPLPRTPFSNGFTNAARIRSVIQFIAFLINTYISPIYHDGSLKDISHISSRLHTRLRICKDGYRALQPGRQSDYGQFKSMTVDMVKGIYRILAPSSSVKYNELNPFPAGHLQFRNFLIIRLLLNYGLRIGELMLLECCSLKSNIKGDKFCMVITTIDDHLDARVRAPSLKNVYANRVLELDKQDYEFLCIYMNKVRKNNKSHDFIFTSSQDSGSALSYSAIYSMFTKIDLVFSLIYPQYKSPNYFDSLKRITPHVIRHTWAYCTLHKIYYQKKSKIVRMAKHSITTLPADGLMAEAKEELRLIAGWSARSQMPDIYAKRFLSENANSTNLQRILQDNLELKEIINFIWDDDYGKK